MIAKGGAFVKIKEICQKTGLTDKTVRYYIEEGLVSPFYTENYLGRKSFDFSEEDIARLKNIATLRAFGFSVGEIKELSQGECDSAMIVETVKKRTGECLDESRMRLNALSSIDMSDCADLSKLAEKLSQPDLKIENENAREHFGKRFIDHILNDFRRCRNNRSILIIFLLTKPNGIVFKQH